MMNMTATEAYEFRPGEVAAGLLFLCDHARNDLPAAYGKLGLPPEQFQRHIAYDIGARDLTLGLAQRFRAPAVLTCFSRLLIDPNRGIDDPTLIMKISDGAVVPGNRDVGEAERNARIARYWRPYHQAITATLDGMESRGLSPVIVSIHSFTPTWRGWPRPWHVGLLWDSDDRLVTPLLAGLRADPSLVVGDNEPYHGALEGDTLNTHGTRRGIPHVLIEVRQDLIADVAGVGEWVERLAKVIGEAWGAG
jgi:predicted N-formylglutamate amidohydrolase